MSNITYLIFMILEINNKMFTIDKNIVFKRNFINVNNKKYYFNKNKIKIIYKNHSFSLNIFLKKLEKLKYCIKDIEFCINTENQGVRIDYAFDTEKRKFLQVLIHISIEKFLLFTEDDICVFVAHEIGHLLDVNSAIKNEKKIKLLNKLLIVVSLLFIGISYYYNIYWILSFLILPLIIPFLYAKRLSRLHEYQADVFAVNIIKDYKSVIHAYKKIIKIYGDHNQGILSSHPSFKDRIYYIKRKYWYLRLFEVIFSPFS